MAPISTPQRILQIMRLPREKLQQLAAHPAWRWFWRVFTALSLVAVAVGIYYSFQEIPTEDLLIRPTYLLAALGIYLVTFIMQLLGWHALSQLMFGKISLRDNVKAVATSNLVKYLPTIAWYIANRAHYYHQRGVPQARVVTASLYELGFMVSACAALLAVSWLAGFSVWLAALALAAIALALGFLVTRRSPIDAEGGRTPLGGLTKAFLWYAGTWPIAGLFLWAVISIFVDVPLSYLQTVLHIWLITSLAGYGVSLTLGVLSFAREITLTVLLAQIWPLPVAIATAITVKLMLILGEVICSLILLGVFRLTERRVSYE
ncbi:hypothetical protein K2Z83_08720 [Oscillochloris sp. ZM17-4]|uniref:hypothetical protein n=1 Tax=Oscillochloris sp. ZM17-4 TaxID=2866714 RepID=UPI001C72F5A0|nr:hypothetical protein [Oscillochloris sp. ZM17-4]MBX0327758.1 hypothetical protein [Oscillochloris sp. ZM17-4]